jgi:hypothetical protein
MPTKKNRKKITRHLAGMSPEQTRALLDAIQDEEADQAAGPRPGEEDVREFLESYGVEWGKELVVLLTLRSPVRRMLRFDRTEDASGAHWTPAHTSYAPLEFAGGFDGLRATMANLATHPTRFSLVVWLTPWELAPEMHILLALVRHPNGEEFMLMAYRDQVMLVPARVERMLQMMGVALVPDASALHSAIAEAAVVLADRRHDLQAKLLAAGAPELTEAHWALITAWSCSTDAWGGAFVHHAMSHVSALESESSRLLHLLTTAVGRRFEEVSAAQDAKLAATKRAQDKRLRRMQSDMEKLRTLADGVRKRAERAESENRQLALKLRELAGADRPGAWALPRDTEHVSGGTDRGNGADRLAAALDELFG